MKNILTTMIIALAAAGCNPTPANPESESPDHATEQPSKPAEGTKPMLQLNNGEKWMADASTNGNVAALQAIATDFKAGQEKTPEDYLALHASLQKGIEKMVKECRMKGADHDALHLWLEPLMGMVKGLGQAPSAKEGAVAFAEIDDQINKYHQFFE